MTNTYETDPPSHAAQRGITCRGCGAEWRTCTGTYDEDHKPSLIPNGTIVTTYDDLDRLV